MARRRIGIWLVGAKGGVAATTIVGLVALKKGLIGTVGLTSELPPFSRCDLTAWKDFIIGGHDVRPGSLYDEAARMHHESRAIDGEILAKTRAELDKIEANFRSGTLFNANDTILDLADAKLKKTRETPRAAIVRIAADIEEFRRKHSLAHVVVVNVASTEPLLDMEALPQSWKGLDKCLDSPVKCPLAASSLYAIAAFEAGCSYVNFTPSSGSTPLAIQELALLRESRHAGCDAKTGETLLKSTLAPMFAMRNLNVLSWVGHNIFGNLDGRVLDDPANKKSKVQSKDHQLKSILGYRPQTLVSIEYVESLRDWKTAWDHVHFQGFLGTPMTFQFIWQGCDSLLAAPLVLDLVRFTERAWRNGEIGVLGYLGSFFKSPLNCPRDDFQGQFELLTAWAASIERK